MECVNRLAKHVNECEVRREKYTLPDLLRAKATATTRTREEYVFPALRQPPLFTEPLECTWAFMKQDEVEALLKIRNLDQIKAVIGKKLIHGHPKAMPRLIVVDLLYGGFKFAKCNDYSAMQTGALLSMLYMTHRYFTSSHRTTAEDVYYFFRELLCFHSLEFIPSHKLVFEPNEAQKVLSYFCKIFLRHLPLIRLLALPNFEFAINTTIPPFPVFKKKKKKGKKDKKNDKNKGKKDKGKKKSKK